MCINGHGSDGQMIMRYKACIDANVAAMTVLWCNLAHLIAAHLTDHLPGLLSVVLGGRIFVGFWLERMQGA